jgi:hypothetical protein
MKNYKTTITTLGTSVKIMFITVILTSLNLRNTFANRIDSDLSNTAGTNSGKSHLDIYLFIVALLVICIIIPYWKNKPSSKKA